MSWKNIKEHYRIGHIVQIREGKICIGSPYVSDLISIYFDGKVTRNNLGTANDDLNRYYAEMTADLSKLKELIDTPDNFKVSLPVYTHDGAEIIETKCEEYGWPNVTHDGKMQYDNSYSADKAIVVEWAKRNAAYGVEAWTERIQEAEKRLKECRDKLSEQEANLAKLEAHYPSPKK